MQFLKILIALEHKGRPVKEYILSKQLGFIVKVERKTSLKKLLEVLTKLSTRGAGCKFAPKFSVSMMEY